MNALRVIRRAAEVVIQNEQDKPAQGGYPECADDEHRTACTRQATGGW